VPRTPPYGHYGPCAGSSAGRPEHVGSGSQARPGVSVDQPLRGPMQRRRDGAPGGVRARSQGRATPQGVGFNGCAFRRSIPSDCSAGPRQDRRPGAGSKSPGAITRDSMATESMIRHSMNRARVSFSPCGRRWLVRSDSEHEPDEGSLTLNNRPNPLTRPRFAIAPLGHPLPQGEREASLPLRMNQRS
jgi:hypothetical protein